MKKNKEILLGVGILIAGFVLGISIAILVVESKVQSNASNDGWLGFLGGLLGSFISGVIAVYILYINRKDADNAAEENRKNTDKIQRENFESSIRAQKLNSDIFKYQVHMSIANDVLELVSELIKIAEDYYLNVADNTYVYYSDKIDRSLELCNLIEMKLSNIEEGSEVIEYSRSYQKNFIAGKPPYDRNPTQIKESSEDLKSVVKGFYLKLMDIDCFY